MLRKERVWHTLSELCHREISDAQLTNQERVGFTTLEVATLLTLDRANTSRDLNQLVGEGRVVKLVGKPVLYLDRFFLEERLGEALPGSYTRFTGTTFAHAANKVFPANPTPQFSHLHRAVRWLDLPEEANLPPLPATVYNLAVLVVAHGSSTASSMTDVACRLAKMDKSWVAALDVELEDKPDLIAARIETLVKPLTVAHPDGVLLLVDLPRLSELEAIIKQRTGLNLAVVENVNTGMVVKALRCIERGQLPLEELTHHLRDYALEE